MDRGIILPVARELSHSDRRLNASLCPFLLVGEVSVDHFLSLKVGFKAEKEVIRQLTCDWKAALDSDTTHSSEMQ